MTQFSSSECGGGAGPRYSITTQVYIHTFIHTFINSSGKNSLVNLARDFERALFTVLFLKHPGGCGGVKAKSHKKSLSLFLLLLLRLRLSNPVAPVLSLLSLWFFTNSKHTQTHSHTQSRQYSVKHLQLLPDRLTGVSPPRHPPCKGRPDWPVYCTLSSSHLSDLTFLFNRGPSVAMNEIFVGLDWRWIPAGENSSSEQNTNGCSWEKSC